MGEFRPDTALRSSTDGRSNLDLLTVATWVGQSTWLEQRVFAVMGNCQRALSDAPLTVMLARHARQHAWHAEVWRDRLPELRELDVEALVVSPPGGIDEVLDRIDGAVSDVGAAAIGAGWYRTVLPYLVVRSDRLAGRLSEVSDAPIRRWLGFVASDEVAAWREGESLVRSMLGNRTDLDEALTFHHELERLLTPAD